MPRTVESSERVDETDAANESMPLPWTMVAAALVILWRRQKPVVAAAIALSYVAYLRPGKLATLQVRNLVAPKQTRNKGCDRTFSLVIRDEESDILSKTRIFDDSVFLDRPDLLWMDRLWQALIVGRPGHARLIPMDRNEIARDAKTIFEELGCSKLGVVAYSLRHGGSSWDFMKSFATSTKSNNGCGGAVRPVF